MQVHRTHRKTHARASQALEGESEAGDRSVTLRDRDTMQQERLPISELSALVKKKVGVRKVLEGLG